MSINGLKITIPPVTSFHIRLNLENLPDLINNNLMISKELLKEKTITIPGIFFDIDPTHSLYLFK
jgi:hypothetical protein